jgi:alpha-glucuronidase
MIERIFEPNAGPSRLIQHIYDAHHDGATQAAQCVEDWKKL